MYRWARGVWSTLSQTEKQALYRPRIKSTIFEDVLAGRWRPPATLIPARLTHEEDLALRQWDRPLSRLWMHEDHVEAFLSREKMYGLEVPVGYGGCGFSPYLHARLLSRIASVDRSGRWIHQIMVPNSLGPAQLLLRYGTEKQRMVLLPDIASGEKIPCFALTGPHNGSDAAAMPITGPSSQFWGENLRYVWAPARDSRGIGRGACDSATGDGAKSISLCGGRVTRRRLPER